VSRRTTSQSTVFCVDSASRCAGTDTTMRCPPSAPSQASCGARPRGPPLRSQVGCGRHPCWCRRRSHLRVAARLSRHLGRRLVDADPVARSIRIALRLQDRLRYRGCRGLVRTVSLHNGSVPYASDRLEDPCHLFLTVLESHSCIGPVARAAVARRIDVALAPGRLCSARECCRRTRCCAVARRCCCTHAASPCCSRRRTRPSGGVTVWDFHRFEVCGREPVASVDLEPGVVSLRTCDLCVGADNQHALAEL